MTAQDFETLLEGFPDNTSSQISPANMRNVIDSTLGGYGGIHLTGGPAPQANLTATPRPITEFNTEMVAHDVALDLGDGNLQPAVAGSYLLEGYVSFDGVAGRTYTLELFVGATPTAFRSQARVGVAGRVHLNVAGFRALAQSDTVSLRISSDQDVTWVLEDGALLIRRVR